MLCVGAFQPPSLCMFDVIRQGTEAVRHVPDNSQILLRCAKCPKRGLLKPELLIKAFSRTIVMSAGKLQDRAGFVSHHDGVSQRRSKQQLGNSTATLPPVSAQKFNFCPVVIVW
eukprot:CAMPEP_0175819856 /NCGR_PEP_ID=MMETSP0107_2-20121207/8294_1 /TAXON_ID=195067 ORGANISM="Goniomonas pacifica, Strain CCMP1869" /NCGR_SAMPLE_ID=MMETSP0107_2 /ASSEMBLY_ACC=CAM_ASM_000203 /LENGTH=113 /DNA_ID=CAMNT_0017132135 /DNA_START=88 /DNA_END=426 /DNA_ORIENTATION=-